jgi:hypothetical protein
MEKSRFRAIVEALVNAKAPQMPPGQPAYFTEADPAYQAELMQAQRPLRRAEAFGKNAYDAMFEKMLAGMGRK